MFEDIWINYLFFFLMTFMVLYVIWYAMGKDANKKTEPNNVLYFLDKHLLLVGSLLCVGAILFFAVSLYIGAIYITINAFDTGGLFYIKYDLTSPLFNIIFDFLLITGLFCFYGHFNKNNQANKKILKSLWNRKLAITIFVVSIIGAWSLLSPFFVYHNFYGNWVVRLDEDEPMVDRRVFVGGNVTFADDGTVQDRYGGVLIENDDYFDLNNIGERKFKDNSMLDDFTVDTSNRIILGRGLYYNLTRNVIEDTRGIDVMYYDSDWSGLPSIVVGFVLFFFVVPLLVYIGKTNRKLAKEM